MLYIAKEETLARRLGCSISTIYRITERIDDYYFINEIPKSNGGIRIIEAPNFKLKTIQKKILTLLKRFPLSECAFGSIKGKSNKSNASAHRGSTYIFQSDLRSFYTSIRYKKIHNIYLSILCCAPPIARILTKLTTFNNHLPTGSPTSPYLANILMLETDFRLEGLAVAYGLTYTRYMDDLTFSGLCIPTAFEQQFYKIMQQSGFKLNKKKTGIFGKDKPQIITGIGINTGKLKIPRNYKAKIRAVRKSAQDGLIQKDIAEKRITAMQRYIDYIEN